MVLDGEKIRTFQDLAVHRANSLSDRCAWFKMNKFVRSGLHVSIATFDDRVGPD